MSKATIQLIVIDSSHLFALCRVGSSLVSCLASKTRSLLQGWIQLAKFMRSGAVSRNLFKRWHHTRTRSGRPFIGKPCKVLGRCFPQKWRIPTPGTPQIFVNQDVVETPQQAHPKTRPCRCKKRSWGTVSTGD